MKKLLTLTVIIFLFSCSKYTAQKAINDVTKANDKFPEPVATWVRDKYPCTITETNTVIETRDSIVYIDCPDLPVIIHEPNDTIYSTQTVLKTVKVPVHLPIEIRYITKWVEDSAKIFVLTKQNQKLTDDNKGLSKQVGEMKDKRDYWRIRFFILLAGVLLYFGIKIYSNKVQLINKLKNLTR